MAKQKKLNGFQLKQANSKVQPSKYGKLIMSKEDKECGMGTFSIYDISRKGVENYKKVVGELPLYIEFAESVGIRISDSMMKQMFGEDSNDEMVLGSWRDHVLVVTKDGKDSVYPFRAAFENDAEYRVLAYNETVTMTNIEAGLARLVITGSSIGNYIYQFNEQLKLNDVLHCGATAYVNMNDAFKMCNAAKEAIGVFEMMSAHKYID